MKRREFARVCLLASIASLVSCGGTEEESLEGDRDSKEVAIGMSRAALSGVDAKIVWDGWKGPAVRIRLNKPRACQLIYDPGALARTVIAAAVGLFTNPIAGIAAAADLAVQTLWIKSRLGIDGVTLYFNIATGRLYRVERRGCASSCRVSGCTSAGGTAASSPPCQSAADCPGGGLCLHGRCEPVCGPNDC